MKKRKQENCRNSRAYKIKKGEMIPKKNHFPFFDVCFAEYIFNGYFEWVQVPDPPWQLEIGV